MAIWMRSSFYFMEITLLGSSDRLSSKRRRSEVTATEAKRCYGRSTSASNFVLEVTEVLQTVALLWSDVAEKEGFEPSMEAFTPITP